MGETMKEADRELCGCVVVFVAGWGDAARFSRLAIRFKEAIREAVGELPTPLALAPTFDAQVWLVAAKGTPKSLASAIMRRLGKPDFDFSRGYGADRMITFEVTDQKVIATDAAIDAAVAMGKMFSKNIAK
jgi:hypothetical protein